MKFSKLNALLAAAGLVSVGLVGCGGGGSSTPTVTMQSVPVTVVDGAIKNALVCLDKNGNGACDADEPSGKTAADGTVTLQVDPADVGKYPVLALVGTDAVDVDNGPVTVPFALKAPADATAVVSPLTTLVQAHIEVSNTTTAQAEAAVKDQLGLSSSLLADFTKGNDDASKQAATLARLVVVTKQEQVTLTSGAKDSGGKALSAADIEAAVNARLLQLLPSLIQAASDPAVAAAATPAEKEAALLAAAQALAAEAGLTKDNVATVVAATRQAGTPDSAAADNGASAVLRWFSFADVHNYLYRAFRTTVEQAAVDANGKRHYDEYRERSSVRAGSTVREVWNPDADDNDAVPWLRNQIFWTGSEWFDCPTTFVHEATPWNAQGESESLYCKSNLSKNKRTARDVAGVKLIDLVKEIRAYPLTDTAGKFADWGPNPSDSAIVSALGAKTFPAGSTLYYQTGTPLVNPDLYGSTSNDVAKVYPADIANGVESACAPVTPSNSASYESDATTLEQVVARAPGVPCAYPASGGSGPTNEAWGMTTVSIGDISVSTFEVPGSDYKNNLKRIRVGFGADKTVTYYSCLARINGNSARNCTAIGSGSYSIETQGDARVLRLAGVPSAAASLSYNRILVERGGKVYYGQRDKLIVTNQLRLNHVGADALLSALGLD